MIYGGGSRRLAAGKLYVRRRLTVVERCVTLCESVPRGDRMSELERFGVSMPADLLEQFDRAIEDAGYANRSEAMRDMARRYLIERQWELPAGEVIGTITL